MVGEALSVTVTTETGNEFDSEATDPVKADKSGVFELVDDNGFQVDGTALPTDTLRISYGADLGTPQNVTWYHDGAIMAVYSLNNGNLTQAAFNSNACRSKNPTVTVAGTVYQELALGTWMATIENTEGELWTSNEVEVALTDIAIMSDVSIEDDYDTASVEIAKDTDLAIINVTFNKDYEGTLYLIDSKYEKSLTDHDDNVADFTSTTGAGSIKDTLTEVKSLANLTNKKATATATALASTSPGIYYEDATGALHCKILVDLTGKYDDTGELVTRGNSYYLVWDQADIDGDEITVSAKKDDLNVSDDMVVPYVEAPDSLVVSSFAKGSTTVKVDALDENGDKLAWMTEAIGSLTGLGLTSAKIFMVDTNAKASGDASKNAGGLTVKDGTYTFTTTQAINNAYVYVQLKTIAGIFGKDSITLESGLSESAREAVTSISLEEDSSDPTAAVVKFKGLSSKAPGKVYIMQGNDATTEALSGTAATDKNAYAKIAAHDLDDAIASADVEGGAASVTIANVFKATDMEASLTTYGSDVGNNAFVAVFVPDDEELWMRANSLAADGEGNMLGFQLKPTITSFDKSDMTVSAYSTGAAGKGKVVVSGIVALDQFGNAWIGDANVTEAKYVAKNTVNNVDATITETADATTYTVTATTGATTVTFSPTTNVDKGDGVKVDIAGLASFSLTIKAKDAVTFSATGVKVGTATEVATTSDDANAKAVGPKAFSAS